MRNKRVYRSMVADTISPDHFLKKVFKKKPGGTVVGNLIRLAANKATGGILGTGANRLPVSTVDDKKGPAPAWFGDVQPHTKSIQETIYGNNITATKDAVKKLPGDLVRQLVDNQTDASNLPKTKAIRDAERTAESVKEETVNASIGGGMSFNPLYMVAILGGIILLFMFARKG